MQPDPYAGIHHCGINGEGTQTHLVLVDEDEHEAVVAHRRHSRPTRRHKTQRRQVRMLALVPRTGEVDAGEWASRKTTSGYAKKVVKLRLYLPG